MTSPIESATCPLHEDGAIARLFADLDRKLSAWARLMRAADFRLMPERANPGRSTPESGAAAVPSEECNSPAPAAPAENDEEALLSSLAPETANAIRVQRRLCNGRRSVQELLANYAETPHEERPRTWWSRAKK